MIRTVIEVEGKDAWDFEQQLKAALDKLGYEPKPSEAHTRWMADIWEALHQRGLNPTDLAKEVSDRRNSVA